MDNLGDLSRQLARIAPGAVKAVADGDRVLIMIQNAPDELRKLANELERLNVQEVRALVAYKKAAAGE